MTTPSIVPPGSTIGILGGGQLGRMTALAAARLGYRCLVYAPDEHAIAGDVAAGHVRGAYDDAPALRRFADQVDVITYEFENVPEAAVAACLERKPVRPGIKPIHVAQHRLREKQFFASLGIGTAGYVLLTALLVPLAIVPLIALYWRWRLGGMSGDCHGASIEVTETLTLAAVVFATA